MRAVKISLCTLVLAAAGVFAVFTVGLRRKSPLVLGVIRRFNRAYVNPRQRDAGTPGAYASIIQHVGRATGTSYATPIVASGTEDGFVIALPYGSQADWLKNVLAAGSATILHEGRSDAVERPELVPIAAADAYFSRGDRRAHRVFGTDQCLRVRRVDDDRSAAAG